jgi:pilus assembly protein CpaF
VSLSDRFRRGPSDGEDIPSVDSSRVLDNLGTTDGLGAVGPEHGDVAEESGAAAALVAPPIAAGDEAPWRSKGRPAEDEAPAVEMAASADAVAGEATIVDEVTADEAGSEDANDAVAAEDDAVATAVVDDLADTEVDDESLAGNEVLGAAGDSFDADEAVVATAEREWSTGEAGFKPWESPMSSGFESTLESLSAAMTTASDTDTDADEAFDALELVGSADEAAEAVDASAAAEDVEEIAERTSEDTAAMAAGVEAVEAAPAAPPLASPAFGRSKFGAMKRDAGGSTFETVPGETNGHGGRDWASEAPPVVAADEVAESDEPSDERPAPRGSIFAPSVSPADGRATSYGLGDRSSSDAPIDPLASLKKRVEDALLRRIGARLAEGEIKEEELRSFVERELGAVLIGEQTALSKSEREVFVSRLTDDLLGHGPMEQFLKDESVTEVMVSGLEPMYVERKGRLELTDVRFTSEAQLRQVIERIVGRVGRRIDESSPMVDARLPDGSRVNAIIPPLSVDGPALTIRKFSQKALTVEDLTKTGSLSQNAADMLSACVRGRLNILVTGGTGSGKTTMLNILSSFIPDDQRIVTIEDAVELRLSQHHVIRLEARPSNIEGKGAVPIRELVRNSLRMRPDRIIVGEVRSGEALDMLQAMNTGHDGSLSTLHANTPRDVLARLETMVLMAGFELPVRAIREQIASAVDLIVHISRLRDGTRRVTHIVEVEGMEGEIITLTDLYLFDYTAGIDDDGRFKGQLKATGLRPKFSERLADQGIEVPLPSVGFDPKGEIAVPAGLGWGR